jgi:hypothetical protein
MLPRSGSPPIPVNKFLVAAASSLSVALNVHIRDHWIPGSVAVLGRQRSPRGANFLTYALTICEAEVRPCGDQNTTFQSRFMLTTVKP